MREYSIIYMSTQGRRKREHYTTTIHIRAYIYYKSTVLFASFVAFRLFLNFGKTFTFARFAHTEHLGNMYYTYIN